LLGGLTALGAFTLHGAIFLSLRTTGKIEQRAQQTARRLWLPNAVIVLGLVIATYFVTDVFTRLGFNPGVTAVGAGVAILAVGWLLRSGRNGWAFGINALAIVLSVATVFRGLYPRVMISSLNPDWSLTVTNASSSPYTLKVMTIVAAIFVPVVLLYQGWTYWIFRKRVTAEALEY